MCLSQAGKPKDVTQCPDSGFDHKSLWLEWWCVALSGSGTSSAHFKLCAPTAGGGGTGARRNVNCGVWLYTGPLVATLVDTSGLLLYFLIAQVRDLTVWPYADRAVLRFLCLFCNHMLRSIRQPGVGCGPCQCAQVLVRVLGSDL